MMSDEPAVKLNVGKLAPLAAPGQNMARADWKGSEAPIVRALPGVFNGASGHTVGFPRHAFKLQVMELPLDVNVS